MAIPAFYFDPGGGNKWRRFQDEYIDLLSRGGLHKCIIDAVTYLFGFRKSICFITFDEWFQVSHMSPNCSRCTETAIVSVSRLWIGSWSVPPVVDDCRSVDGCQAF